MLESELRSTTNRPSDLPQKAADCWLTEIGTSGLSFEITSLTAPQLRQLGIGINLFTFFLESGHGFLTLLLGWTPFVNIYHCHVQF